MAIWSFLLFSTPLPHPRRSCGPTSATHLQMGNNVSRRLTMTRQIFGIVWNWLYDLPRLSAPATSRPCRPASPDSGKLFASWFSRKRLMISHRVVAGVENIVLDAKNLARFSCFLPVCPICLCVCSPLLHSLSFSLSVWLPLTLANKMKLNKFLSQILFVYCQLLRPCCCRLARASIILLAGFILARPASYLCQFAGENIF